VNEPGRLIVLTGASGSGKTTIAKTIEQIAQTGIEVRFFDTIGVPSIEEMIERYGSPEDWQAAKTHEWFATLAPLLRSGVSVIFDGQMRIGFVEAAAAAADLDRPTIVLVDCDDEVRRRRRAVDRQQPELANADMMNWAAFLRREAIDDAAIVLDTSVLSVDQSVHHILELMDAPVRNQWQSR